MEGSINKLKNLFYKLVGQYKDSAGLKTSELKVESLVKEHVNKGKDETASIVFTS